MSCSDGGGVFKSFHIKFNLHLYKYVKYLHYVSVSNFIFQWTWVNIRKKNTMRGHSMLLHITWIASLHDYMQFQWALVDSKKRQKRISFWFSNPTLISFSVCLLACLFSGSCFPPGQNDCPAVVKSNGGVIADRGNTAFWLERVPWDPVKCTRLSSESTWLHSTNDRIKRATESPFTVKRVRNWAQ